MRKIRRGPISLFNSSRKFRLTLAICVSALLLYALSFGPVFWLISHTTLNAGQANAFYRPIFAIWSRHFFRESDSPVGYALNELWGHYASLGMSRDRPFVSRTLDGEIHYLLP